MLPGLQTILQSYGNQNNIRSSKSEFRSMEQNIQPRKKNHKHKSINLQKGEQQIYNEKSFFDK